MDSRERVREAIRAQGRRQAWVAEQMGISPSYLTKLLDGRRPWLPHLRGAAARVLNIPEALLFLAGDCRETEENIMHNDDTQEPAQCA